MDLTDGSVKRRLILDAAVRVFARSGFHTSRVTDVAREAGVAHGLVYHYFRSKDELLETIFRESWDGLVDAIDAVEESEVAPAEQLRRVAAILLRSWRNDPDLVRVLVREVARSPELQRRIGRIHDAFAAIERIVVRGQADGSFRKEIDPCLASYVFYGAVDEILTGWVLGQLPDGDEGVGRAEHAVVDLVCGGLVGARTAAPA